MTAKELAAMLDGNECGDEISKDLARQAKAAGLVVVFGASDDLIELEGAIYDEIDGPGEFRLDTEGLCPEWDESDALTKDEAREYFRRENTGCTVEAIWCEDESFSWTFTTDIPHETFIINEEGKKFCRGIVIALADLARGDL